ncbi:MAG: hypothetical protein AAGK66_06985 [Pseudomonadota bacterium]
MTRHEIIEFYNSVSSFAVPNREEIERVNALSPKDRGALLEYILEKSEESGIYEGTVEDIWQEARERYSKKLAAE